MNTNPSSPRRSRRDIARYGLYAPRFTAEDLDLLDQSNAAFCDRMESIVRIFISRMQQDLDQGEVPPENLPALLSAISAGGSTLRALGRLRSLPDIF